MVTVAAVTIAARQLVPLKQNYQDSCLAKTGILFVLCLINNFAFGQHNIGHDAHAL